VALFQSSGSDPLFIVVSSRRARYETIASPPSLSTQPTLTGL